MRTVESHHNMSSSIVTVVMLKGDLPDIQCGQSMDGIADDELKSFQFSNLKEQDVIFAVSNDSFAPTLKIRDSAGYYVESVDVTDCDVAICDGVLFTANALSPGLYTVEIVSDGKGGGFHVDVICSVEPLDGEGTVSVYSDSYQIVYPL